MSVRRQTDRQTDRPKADSLQTTKASQQPVVLLPQVAKCLLFHETAAVSVAVCAVRCCDVAWNH